MNKVILIGRLTRDPDVRYSQEDNSMAIARYTLAVDRRGRRDDNGQNTDFISCVAFGKSAEFAESRSAGNAGSYQKNINGAMDPEGFMTIPDGVDDELPFA